MTTRTLIVLTLALLGTACLPTQPAPLSVSQAQAVIAEATATSVAQRTEQAIALRQATVTVVAQQTHAAATVSAPLTQQAVAIQLAQDSAEATQAVEATATAVWVRGELQRADIAEARARSVSAQEQALRDHELRVQVERLASGLVDILLVTMGFVALVGFAALVVWAYQHAWLQRETNLLASLRRLPNNTIMRWDHQQAQPVIVYRPDLPPASVPLLDTIPTRTGGRQTEPLKRVEAEAEARIRAVVVEFLDLVLAYHAEHPEYPRNRIPTKDDLGRGGSWWTARTRPIGRYLVQRAAGTAADSGTFVADSLADVAELRELVRQTRTPLDLEASLEVRTDALLATPPDGEVAPPLSQSASVGR